MNQMQYLTEIIRKGDTYQLRFEVPETVTFQYVHPVYTNAKSMIDAIGISKNIKATSQATKTRINEVIEDVTKEVAQMVYEIAKKADGILSVETFESVKGFAVRIK